VSQDRAVSQAVIRPGRPEDLPTLDAIEQSGAETFTAFGQPLVDDSPPAPNDQWFNALDAGLLWVADDPASGVIGFVAGEITDDGLYIEEVDVVMTRQRQGYGRRLMQAAIEWARARRLPAVTLTTFRSIPFNGPFYASMGFVELKELTPHLRTTLANEVARGFEDRCAMRLAL
jgi:GNAT superfamily N-acetyltransferase